MTFKATKLLRKKNVRASPATNLDNKILIEHFKIFKINLKLECPWWKPHQTICTATCISNSSSNRS